MAGTKYSGEWQTKVRDLVEAIRKPRHVLLYIPNLSDLSTAGTWSRSDANVASALAPYIDDGSVTVLGESTSEEFERGLGKIPSLRRLFETVLLTEFDVDRTRSVLTAIRDEEGSHLSDEMLDRLLEVSAQSSILNDIHNIDQFLSLYEEIGNLLVDTRRHDSIAALQQQIEHLAFVAKCSDSIALGDALVVVSLVNRSGQSQDAIQKIIGMYEGLASRRRLAAEILGELYLAAEERVYLLIAGLDAYGLLKGEAGLHQVNRRYKLRAARSTREIQREDRELVRVEVTPAPHEPPRQFHRTVKTRISPLKPPRKHLISAEFALSLFHEPTLRSVELWTRGPKEAAVARGLLILSACADSYSGAPPNEGIVRQYDLGLGPRIKDNRTGRVTTRVHHVLKGEVDPVMDP